MKTVDALVLIGWMEKEQAIAYLQQQCVFEPPLTRKQAEKLWRSRKQAVDAIPERVLQQPTRRLIPSSSKDVAADFLRRFPSAEVVDIINIEPLSLLAHQLHVVIDVADEHAKQLTGSEWTKVCLTADRPIDEKGLQGRIEDGVLKFNLPHSELMVGLDQDGVFRMQQGAAYIGVCELEGRLLLKAGYHRCFAFCRATRNEPDAKDRSLLVVLTKTVPPKLDGQHDLRMALLSSRPPLVSDFFDETLAMRVKLRQTRYEMHIKADVVAVADQSGADEATDRELGARIRKEVRKAFMSFHFFRRGPVFQATPSKSLNSVED